MTRRDFIKLGAVSVAASAVSDEALAAEASGLPSIQSAPGPDLGSHWPVFEALSRRCVPRKSFLEAGFTDIATWADAARRTLREDFHYAPPPCAPQAECVERVDKGAYVRERVLINTTPDIRIPVYVLVPKALDRPAPGVVALHDHGGFYLWGKEKLVALEHEHPVLTEFKKTYYGGRSIADELAARGFVVVVGDMLHWGERGLFLDADPPKLRERTAALTEDDVRAFNARSWAHEELMGRTALACGVTWSGIIAWDDQRVADYLLSRPDVDPERVGCVGLSVGSVRSIFLGALHEKVRAAVAVCWMCEYQAMVRNNVRNGIGFTKLVPGLYGDLDWPDLAGLHWPGDLMTINGLKDQLYPLEGAQRAVEKVKQIFAKANAPDKYEGVFFDGPHEFNVEMQERAFDWLAAKLG